MKTYFVAITVLFFSSLFVGCGDSNTNETGAKDVKATGDGHDHDHDHDHKPKHGGHLIEIGRNHEYHAELVDDHKTESITVYLMDSHMEPLKIKDSTISLVLTAGDETKKFDLLSSEPGGSDEFSSNDSSLMEMIEKEEVKGKLRINIKGKPYSGAFEHHAHGHDDDSHKGHDHDH